MVDGSSGVLRSVEALFDGVAVGFSEVCFWCACQRKRLPVLSV